MLITQLSGQEVARLDKESLQTLEENKYGNSVRALKWHLQPAVGASIYRLKLISGDVPLEDSCQLLSLGDVDLVLTLVAYHVPTAEEEDQFLSAARDGRASDLELLLQLPIDPNAVMVEFDPNLENHTDAHTSALFHAANAGHLQTVELLLDAAADIDKLNCSDDTALSMACWFDRFEVVKHLLRRRANPNHANYHGETPLLNAIAIANGSSEALVEVLIQSAADPNCNDQCHPPLHVACAREKVRIVELLIGAKASVSERVSEEGQTALHRACDNQNLRIVELLIGVRAWVNATDSEGQTSLHRACDNQNVRFVEQHLIGVKAWVNATDSEGQTALHRAWDRSLDIVKILVDSNADVNAEAGDGRTPLSIARYNNQKPLYQGQCPADQGPNQIAQLLVNVGADWEKAALAIGREIVAERLFGSYCFF